eukprot:scaffold1221_cov207-Amphora_coffeaeformis.AAC.27
MTFITSKTANGSESTIMSQMTTTTPPPPFPSLGPFCSSENLPHDHSSHQGEVESSSSSFSVSTSSIDSSKSYNRMTAPHINVYRSTFTWNGSYYAPSSLIVSMDDDDDEGGAM